MDKLISKLDIEEFIKKFKTFFAREKDLKFEGDINIHYRFILELEKIEFIPPPTIKNLDTQLNYLKKSGILKLEDIFEFIKIIRYFFYLKKIVVEGALFNYISKINIPEEIKEVEKLFNREGNLIDEIDDRLLEITKQNERVKEQIRFSISKLFSSSKIAPYLVDRQIHLINGNEAILVRGGFNHILKAKVVGRSSGGFFYVVPNSIEELKTKEEELKNRKLEIIFEYEKNISATFSNKFLFLRFINREFDKFDNYQARVLFAKENDLEFLIPKPTKEIYIKDFAHPALKKPIKTTIDFSKNILLITGVNAGGKTMLLKSILAVSLLSKYLIPLNIDAKKSKVGSFKEIVAILDDPQNVKNDISTFAGRMVEFSKLFNKKDVLVGVDEIELGTDADEASSLFSVILKNLKKNIKIVVTTHHKRLASLMAKESDVELLAALYDEENRQPTYKFLQGTIGKSYAFETAQRYRIPLNIIKEAKKQYGEDKENLNDLIQKNINLELELRAKIEEYKSKIEKIDKLKENLEEQKESEKREFDKIKSELEREYLEAIEEAKKAVKLSDKKEIHRQLNISHKKREKIKDRKVKEEESREIFVGDFVKYQNLKGEVISIKKNEAMIEVDGVKVRVDKRSLRKTNAIIKKKTTSKTTFAKRANSSIKLDLHGLRVEEAIEKLDQFLSDSLINGFEEVIIYHGIGTGKLSKAVKEFLQNYPNVKSFSDAPPNMGGFGAKIVKF